jgi:phage antirepressor YoqD-like protein
MHMREKQYMISINANYVASLYSIDMNLFNIFTFKNNKKIKSIEVNKN